MSKFFETQELFSSFNIAKTICYVFNLPQNASYNRFYSTFCRTEHAVSIIYIWKVLIFAVIFFAAQDDWIKIQNNYGILFSSSVMVLCSWLMLRFSFCFCNLQLQQELYSQFFSFEVTFGRLSLALNHMQMGHLGFEEIISYGKVVKLGYCLPEICENLHFLAFIWFSPVPTILPNTALYFTNSDLNSFHSTESHSLSLHPAVASLGYTLSRECYCVLIFQYRRKLVVLLYSKI